MLMTDDDWRQHNERVAVYAATFTRIVNGSMAAATTVLTAYGRTILAILDAMPAERSPRRSRVAWSKRKHKRARRRA